MTPAQKRIQAANVIDNSRSGFSSQPLISAPSCEQPSDTRTTAPSLRLVREES